MPGCWVKEVFSLLWSNIEDNSYFLFMLGPCSVGSEVSRKTHLLFATAELTGFSQCVILSEKDVVVGGKRVDFLLSLLVEGLMFPVL